MKILNTIKPQMLDRNALAFLQEAKYGASSINSLGCCSLQMQAKPDTLDCLEIMKSSPIFGPYVSGTAYGQEYAQLEPVFSLSGDVATTAYAMLSMICPYTRTYLMGGSEMYDLIARTFQPQDSGGMLYKGESGYDVLNTNTQVIGLAGSAMKLTQRRSGTSGSTVAFTYGGGTKGNLAGPLATRYGYITRVMPTGKSEISRMGRKTQEISIYTHLCTKSNGSSKPKSVSADQCTIFFPDAEAGRVSSAMRDKHNARTFHNADGISFGNGQTHQNIKVLRLNLCLKDVHFNKVLL